MQNTETKSTILISLQERDLQTIIIDCVNSCLKHHPLHNSPQQEADRWFDLTELCNYLPDKPVKPTVYGWVHHSLIPSHKKGKKLFFLKSEIDNWLKEGRKKTGKEIASEAEQYVNTKKKK